MTTLSDATEKYRLLWEYCKTTQDTKKVLHVLSRILRHFYNYQWTLGHFGDHNEMYEVCLKHEKLSKEDDDDHCQIAKLLRYILHNVLYADVDSCISLPKVPLHVMGLPHPDNVQLDNRKLQVIFKLANIMLTPENPSYPGGSWHVEGMKNENIVASGIYYYQCKNITESRLEFRTAVQGPTLGQSDHYGAKTIYGMTHSGPLNQPVGSIITQEDRCIAFPNYLQHKVAPFSLIDHTQEGYRKILVFFLVDPDHEIISTSNVRPQQLSWIIPSLIAVFQNVFPIEVIMLILEYCSDYMTLDQAEKYRIDLMKERTTFVADHSFAVYECPFNFCE
ncbi:hypothetical protein AKO1_005819, partial [Acrasis kona]